MRYSEGEAKTADECIKIARENPDYFTDSCVANLAGDLKEHQIFVEIEYGSVIGFAVVASKYHRSAELLWLAVKREH